MVLQFGALVESSVFSPAKFAPFTVSTQSPLRPRLEQPPSPRPGGGSSVGSCRRALGGERCPGRRVAHLPRHAQASYPLPCGFLLPVTGLCFGRRVGFSLFVSTRRFVFPLQNTLLLVAYFVLVAFWVFFSLSAFFFCSNFIGNFFFRDFWRDRTFV